jgi:hypothetical protein
MPLAAGIASFAQALVAIEERDPPASSAAEAAHLFADAFTKYFANATVSGIPLLPQTNILPQAVKALEGGLTLAFAQPQVPIASANLIQVAFDLYLNATPVSAMWPIASSIVPLPPGALMGFMAASGLVGLFPENYTTKVLVATGITTYFNSMQVVVGSATQPII